MLFFDAARFSENAYFIKKFEPGYANVSIANIVKEMFSYADGFFMSAKKDCLVNMGGMIGLRDKEIFYALSEFVCRFEGYITYGGLAGRDMGAMAAGLLEAVEEDFLVSRINQVAHLGNLIESYGIDVKKPFGGHAIYIDAKLFYPDVAANEYPAQLLATNLYVNSGVRGIGVGSLNSQEINYEVLRLSIPRRVYTDRHMEYVAKSLNNIFQERVKVKTGLKIVYEQEKLRYFTVKLEKL